MWVAAASVGIRTGLSRYTNCHMNLGVSCIGTGAAAAAAFWSSREGGAWEILSTVFSSATPVTQ